MSDPIPVGVLLTNAQQLQYAVRLAAAAAADAGIDEQSAIAEVRRGYSIVRARK